MEMDVTLLIFAASAIIALIVICTILLRRQSGIQQGRVNIQEIVAQHRPVRRAAGVRNARHRMQGNANHQQHEEDNRVVDEDSDDAVTDKVELSDHKIGAKKRAKLAAKAEKKIQREAAERGREERKKLEQRVQEERNKQAEKEYAEKMRLEEAERKAREEKEKKEYEEYLKMKETFSIEEEGYEEESKQSAENLLQEFINYIKQNKVLILEDLAAHFGLKTTSVVEKIQELQANGSLTGVIDDRGKFIYISKDELLTVAKFVRQRGRVTITELAENSNCLINLTSAKSCRVLGSVR